MLEIKQFSPKHCSVHVISKVIVLSSCIDYSIPWLLEAIKNTQTSAYYDMLVNICMYYSRYSSQRNFIGQTDSDFLFSSTQYLLRAASSYLIAARSNW